MNEQTTLDVDSATPVCEHCQQPFEPRTHSGGRPQRYCGDDCRIAANNAKRGAQQIIEPQQITNKSDGPDTLAQPKSADKPADKPQRIVLLPDRPAILAEIDANGDLILVQWPADERGEVRIAADDIDAFVDRLTDLLGYRSAP